MNPIWHFVNGVPTIGAPVNLGPLAVTASAVTSGVPILGPNGSASAPTHSFANFPNAGWYASAADVVRLALLGSNLYTLSSSAFTMDSSLLLTIGDVSVSRLAADVIAPAAGDAYGLASKAWIRTAPTIASGFGTSPSVVVSNGTAAFTINVGTGGSATSGVITLPAATTGWVLHIENLTAQAANRASVRTCQTASTTTSATIQNQNVATGAATAWAASDVLSILATAY